MADISALASRQPAEVPASLSQPEPIPLRTLALLLTYECTTTDPRYTGLKLGGSTRGDLGMAEGVKNLTPKIWEGEAESVMRRSVHIFAPDTENEGENETASDKNETRYPPATCQIHPLSTDGVKSLSLAERDLIFYETSGSGRDWDAIQMFQAFFDLCPERQEVLVQIDDEGPLILPATSHTVLNISLNSPKHDIRTIIQGSTESDITSFLSGASNNEKHSVLAFQSPHPEDKNNSSVMQKNDKDADENLKSHIILDTTLLQYGDSGRGIHGENYFLGSYSAYLSTMSKICGELKLQPSLPSLPAPHSSNPNTPSTRTQTQNQIWINSCAERAFHRWQNRDKEGWCDYCGRGGKELKRCSACKTKNVWFCSEEHQKAGWKLHKLVCERRVVFGPKRVGE
ncbi:hypothetical protein DL98DRAFT_609842 [Cadophora sp. DSE1049]|nr:hypothetical protein DL98DRAFT_609842 [Cadophora sp. DSE1049]